MSAVSAVFAVCFSACLCVPAVNAALTPCNAASLAHLNLTTSSPRLTSPHHTPFSPPSPSPSTHPRLPRRHPLHLLHTPLLCQLGPVTAVVATPAPCRPAVSRSSDIPAILGESTPAFCDRAHCERAGAPASTAPVGLSTAIAFEASGSGPARCTPPATHVCTRRPVTNASERLGFFCCTTRLSRCARQTTAATVLNHV